MKHPKLLLRILKINKVLIEHGLDDLLFNLPALKKYRILQRLSPNAWRKKEFASRGERIRRTLEDLGPIYVKFGQALSTRKDILADDIADELVKLQDQVPPFSNDVAQQVIEGELGISTTEAFAEFSKTPLASASVAQVHAATLHTGEDVIVKVLRPDVEQWIHADIGLLYELAGFAEKFWPDAKRLHATEIVAEFEKRRNFLHKEINKIHSLKCFKPGGAFYAFPNVSKTGLNGKKFADIALNEKGVALVPGTSFGDSAKNFVRISYANSLENIEKAIKKLSEI